MSSMGTLMPLPFMNGWPAPLLPTSIIFQDPSLELQSSSQATLSATTNIHPGVPGSPSHIFDLADQAISHAQALRAQGNRGAAIQAIQTALKLDSLNVKLKEKLATLLQEAGQFMESYNLFAELFALQPDSAIHCANLGISAQGMDQLDKAMQWYQKAIALSPLWPIPYSNLANCLKITDQPQAAELHYQWAIFLDPGFADAHSNYGNLLKETGRTAEAREQYQLALHSNPHHANAWSNLGGCYKDLNEVGSAIAAYHRALELQPCFPVAMANLVHCLTVVCDWPARDKLLGPLLHLLQGDTKADHLQAVQPHHALVYPLSPQIHKFIARSFSMGVERTALRLLQAAPSHPVASHAKWRLTGERLRVAYMSSDFGNHPLSQLMQHFFGMHNRAQFEIFGYALSPSDGTAARRLIEEGIEHFFDVHHLHTMQIVRLIGTHQIHILVDLNGYTKGARPEILAMRPAPIQVHYMGFAGTLAAPFIDYLVSDEVATPREYFTNYDEKLALMPHSYFVNDYRQTYPLHFPSQELATRASIGLPADCFVYACFNQLYKIDSTIFEVWARLLQRHPNSVLWLLQFPNAAEENLRQAAEQQYGLERHRLIFTPVAVNKGIYMRFIHLADLVLDTPQYNGHTSACDVLWAGVPVVTLPRQHMASRVCASLLTALGCPELICANEDDYERLASRLAEPGSREELAALRAKIQTNRLTSPLFDTQQWVRDVEVLYMAMALRYANGLPPAHLFFKELRPVPDGNPGSEDVI